MPNSPNVPILNARSIGVVSQPTVYQPGSVFLSRAPAAPAAGGGGTIVYDTSGSTSMTAGATSTTIDITAAAVGAECYVWIAIGVAPTGTITITGWSDVVTQVEDGTSVHYALLRRIKQLGDTTFTVSWTNSAKGTLSWVSYTGLNAVTPDEGGTLTTNGVTSRTAVPTPSGTPTAADRWAVGFFSVRTSTAGNKPISWTPDAALTERIDVDNNLAGSAPWIGHEIADSNAAVTQAAHSYTATHNAAESHDGSAILFLIPGAVTSSAISAQPLVVTPPFAFVRMPSVIISRNAAAQVVTATGTPQPLAVSPPFTWSQVPAGAQISASQPLGNPAVGSPQPLVVGPQYVRPPVPGALLFGVAGVAVTPQAHVVTPPFRTTPVPGAVITSNPAAPVVVSSTATPNALVVTPPFTPVPTPPVSITASQPLGNPAAPTPQPIVATTPWTAPVPGAKLFGPGAPPAIVSTVATPAPLVVGPPFTPVPIPLTYLSASQPLGNPAVGSPQPLVVGPAFTLSPVPGAKVFANPTAPAVISTSTPGPLVVGPTFTLAPVPGARVFGAPANTPAPGPLVVTPPWRPAPIPKTYLSANFPLGNPAVRSPQPLVVGPTFRWAPPTLSLASRTFIDHFCPPPTVRPNTGTTTRPSTGTTAYALATTGRPNTGTTSRPDTGTTEQC